MYVICHSKLLITIMLRWKMKCTDINGQSCHTYNQLIWVSYSRSSNEAIHSYLVWSVFLLLLWASTGNVSYVFFHKASQGSWPLPHPLISELTMVRALWPLNASPDWKLSTVPEMEPWKSLIYTRLCQKGEKWPSQCQPRLFYSQPRQLPSARHSVLKPACIPPILLVENLSSKWIAPTDNMQPKLHDEYTCHQLLKM